MVVKALGLAAVLVLVAVVACGGKPGCDSAEVAAQVVATSAANPWFSGGLLIVGVEDGRERPIPVPADVTCIGVAVFEDGSERPMDFNITYEDDGELLVGFDYKGREAMTIPKSEWDAGRRE